MTIASNIPQRDQLTNSKSANAALYGLSAAEYVSACHDWLENEGYDGSGNAYEDVYEWLTTPHGEMHPDDYDGGRGIGSLGQPID